MGAGHSRIAVLVESRTEARDFLGQRLGARLRRLPRRRLPSARRGLASPSRGLVSPRRRFLTSSRRFFRGGRQERARRLVDKTQDPAHGR